MTRRWLRRDLNQTARAIRHLAKGAESLAREGIAGHPSIFIDAALLSRRLLATRKRLQQLDATSGSAP